MPRKTSSKRLTGEGQGVRGLNEAGRIRAFADLGVLAAAHPGPHPGGAVAAGMPVREQGALHR